MESEAVVDSNHVESKEDMFVDAADDIEDNQSQDEMENGDTQAADNEDNQFQEEKDNGDTQTNTNIVVRDTISIENKEDKEELVKDVADLLKQLRDLTSRLSLPGDNNGYSTEKPSGASLSEMIKECSQCVKVSMQERLQTENMIRELRDLTNNQSSPSDDNEDFKEKLGGASLSEMINECSNWVKVSLEERLQTENTIKELQRQIEDLNGKVQVEQNVEVFADRILGSLSTVVNQEELFDYSVLGKIAHVERNTFLLMEQYRWFLYEADQLRQCLTEGGFNVGEPENFGYDRVFVVARGELLDLKKTETEMSDKLSHFADVNRQLVEEVEKEKAMAAAAVSELDKVKVELELEKNRCANTKDKLSMAVTKGKALVQQRDSLKQSLAEKASELEKSLVELQEKSSAAEQCREELGKCQNLVVSLQEMLSEKTAVLENCEHVLSKISLPEELHSAVISQRLEWLIDVVASLQETLLQNNAIFENFHAKFSQISTSDDRESEAMIERLKWLINSVTSLQEMLSQRSSILDRLEEILCHISLPVELESIDTVEKFRWIVEERDALKSNLLEFHRLKDALSLIDLPETVSSTDLETRISWLKESVEQANSEINMLQSEISRIKDAARNDMEQINASLLAELQEKEYIKMQLDDLAHKYEMVSDQAHQASSEKDQMVQLLLKGAGIQDATSDVATLVERCFGKIKELSSASVDTVHASPEEFERMQSLLYLRIQDLMLYEKLLEEDELVRSEVSNLSNELTLASAELASLKVEKDALQKDLERSEDKSLLLKEKLSLAVKKGKGLVQDRENLKQTLGEKNSEIEKLKLELQQQESTIAEWKQTLDEKNSEIEKLILDLQQEESTIAEWRDRINKLSIDVEQVPKLGADLADVKNQRDQFEQFLFESNNMLQKVIEAVDHIVVPVDSSFEEPVEKVNWIAAYVNECQQAKSHAEQELERVREETSLLSSKLAEAELSISSTEDEFSDARNRISELEDALSDVQSQVSRLTEEKRAIEISKENIELDLQKLNEEAQTQTSKFMEACATRKELEDALTLTENNISLISREKEEAQLSRAATEAELEKVREELAMQTDKLNEAYMTIKSLEDALSQAEANASLLSEQSNNVEHSRIRLESELNSLKEEAELQAARFGNASIAMKSLEDALSKAGNDISVLEGEKRTAEQEISALNSKLKACMDELAGTTGSLDNRSSELICHINDLQMLLKNETLLSVVRQHFTKEFENLRNMDQIVKEIKDCFIDTDSKVLEEDSKLTEHFPHNPGNVVNVETEDDDVDAANADSISLGFKKIIEGFQLRDRTHLDNFSSFSTYIDKFVDSLLGKLRETKDEITVTFDQMKSMEQKVKNMEMQKEEHEKIIAMLENNCGALLSTCTNAISKLQFEAKNDLLELRSVPELVSLNDSLVMDATYMNTDDMKPQKSLEKGRYDEVAESLLFATEKVQSLIKQFESTSNVAAAMIEELQKELGESREAYENAIEERSVVQMRVIELEKGLDELQNSCEELRVKNQGVEEKLKEKDAELSSLHHNLSIREREAEDALMSTSELNSLFNRISEIEFSYGGSVENWDSHSSSPVQKLFNVIDNIPKLHLQINDLSDKKEKLQSTLSLQALEIADLKEEIEKHMRNNEESEKIKDELFELTLGIEKLVEILGDAEVVEVQKSATSQTLLPVVEKKISTLIFETRNSKSQAQELDRRLLESQKVIEDLSTKVNLLEDSSHNKTVEPEIVQERSIFEAPSLPNSSEISEIEDVVPVGTNAKPPVPSAAQLRAMRKGSTDHLVLNVDSESTSLINEETAEDKGHVFKSLNTSGLIPKQGKSVADRIDGIWVSGGRVLMSRPKARLGIIAYWMLLHIWLLATVL